MKSVPFKDIPYGTDFQGYWEDKGKGRLTKFLRTPNQSIGRLFDGFCSNATMLEHHRGLPVKFDKYEYCLVEDDVITYDLDELIEKVNKLAEGFDDKYNPSWNADNTAYSLGCSLKDLAKKLKDRTNAVMNRELEIEVKQAFERNDTNIPLLLQKIHRKHP